MGVKRRASATLTSSGELRAALSAHEKGVNKIHKINKMFFECEYRYCSWYSMVQIYFAVVKRTTNIVLF